MVLDAVSNFVRGRADAQLTAEATTLSVEDASIFPDPEDDGEYNLVIWDANNFPRPDQDSDVEIVRVTERDTGADELTVVRAQETTSDVAHPEGSAVHLSPTAKMFSDIEAEYTAQGENFDGQGTSEFENLQSVSTDETDTDTIQSKDRIIPLFKTAISSQSIPDAGDNSQLSFLLQQTDDDVPNVESNYSLAHQLTKNVGDSQKTIWDDDTQPDRPGRSWAIYHVYGEEAEDGFKRFYDTFHISRATAVGVDIQKEINGADERTYERITGHELGLEMEDTDDEYKIMVMREAWRIQI